MATAVRTLREFDQYCSLMLQAVNRLFSPQHSTDGKAWLLGISKPGNV
jgi:hypothetical protein